MKKYEKLNWIKNIFGNNKPASAVKNNTDHIMLAVLPFRNQTQSKEWDYFSDGIAEEIINSLSAITGLTVISRNSSMGFNKVQDLQEIVQKVALGKVIQGSIERSGDRLKLDVELIDFKDHHSIWLKAYDIDIAETQGTLADIIKNVLEKLGMINAIEPLDILKKKESINFEAFDLCLKGRYHFNQREEGLSIGRDFFNQSIKIDANYTPAYAGLSQCYNLLGFYEFVKPKEVYPKAKEAALKALELDNTLVEAHTSLAFTHTLYNWDWQSAEKEFLLALELNPGYATAHHWYSEFLMATGRFEEGIAQARKAQRFDPLGLIINTLLGMAYFLSGDFDRSIAECKKTLKMAPDYLPVYIWLGLSYCKKGMYNEAIGLFQHGRAISIKKNTKMITLLGYAYASDGQLHEEELILNELDVMAKFGYVSSFERARIAVGDGDQESALNYLEAALEERSTWLTWINVDPTFDELRSQPRFEAIIAKMNFPNLLRRI